VTGGGCGDPVVAANGDVYVATFANLVALRKNGTVRWTLAGVSAGWDTGPALSADGVLRVLRSDPGVLTAVYPDGTIAWQREVTAEPTLGPVTGDGSTWVLDSGPNTLTQLHADGSPGLASPLWLAGAYDYPAVDGNGALWVVGGQDGHLVRVGP
jgi:hypothetical protein